MLRSSASRALRNHTSLRFASTVTSTTRAHGAYCRDLVQQRDYEAYLTSYFYPRELQGTYYALRAFYVSTLYPANEH